MVDDKMRRAHAANQKDAVRAKQRYKEQSRDRLSKIIEKKLNTSFIGALAKFEKYFGYLWGQDSDKELTDNQRLFKQRWEDCRNEVLNNGNNQLRALVAELKQYELEWKRYQMNLQKGIPNNG